MQARIDGLQVQWQSRDCIGSAPAPMSASEGEDLGKKITKNSPDYNEPPEAILPGRII